MRERCGCGASIRGRRADVLKWRHDHRHVSTTEPDDEHISEAYTQAEHAGPRHFESESAHRGVPVVDARVGFMPTGSDS